MYPGRIPLLHFHSVADLTTSMMDAITFMDGSTDAGVIMRNLEFDLRTSLG
jgi:hypothetical protein